MTEPAQKRLLAISWEMPPLSGPRAVQVTRTLAALPAYGWRSRVICFGPRSDRYHQDHRVSLEELSGGQARRIPVASPEEWLIFRALWRVAPPLKHLPDEKRVWMRGALQAARAALAAEPADLIVSFAQPWTDHLIGMQLARESGLPWVAHFSDPWVDSPYFRWRGAVRNRAVAWEREIISAADRVVFVNVHARDRVMAKYPESWRAKTAVIPQTHDGGGATSAGSSASDRPLRLVYTGRFYPGIRTPEALLHALARLRGDASVSGRVVTEFVGADMEEYARLGARLGLGDTVTFHGRVPPTEARSRASAADVLLVIDAPSAHASLFLPSKLIDYLPLRRTILGLTPAAGSSADVLRELGYPVVPPDDVDAIATALRELLQRHRAGHLAPSPQHDSVAARFDIATTTRSFAAVLDQVREPR